MAYQDTWHGGRRTAAGYRECAERYEVIRAAVAPLPAAQRRGHALTVLDFGAAAGYFSTRLAEEFGAQCLAVDSDRSVLQARSERVTVRRQRMTPADVSGCRPVDVVLALSVLHHNPAWRELLTALRGRARSLLLVEVAHPEEPLREALAREDRSAQLAALQEVGYVIGHAAGVWSDHPRPLYAVPRRPLLVRVQAGNGNCSRYWAPLLPQLQTVLGYRPVPGSLNVEVQTPLDGEAELYLGRPGRTFWDKRRARTGKTGGDYQFWPARFGTGDRSIAGHVMRPGVRTHGPVSLELVTSAHLRTAWGLEDGAPLWVKLP